MVATSGAGWVLAPCLVGLILETDKLYPNRSTTSDGSIGDQAHAARESDHNPDGGYVRAVDVTDDDAHGCDVSVLAHHLVAARDERVKYLIHKGTIWKSYASNGVPAWQPQVYTGINAHEHHLHVSVKTGEERTAGAWWPAAHIEPPVTSEEDDMAPYSLWKLNGSDRVYHVAADGVSARHVSNPDALAFDRDLLALGRFDNTVHVAEGKAEKWLRDLLADAGVAT